MIIGKLPEDDVISLRLVAGAQALLDIQELQDLGMLSFDWELDLEGLRYTVCRGAQLGIIPTRIEVADCAGACLESMGISEKEVKGIKQLIELIPKLRLERMSDDA